MEKAYDIFLQSEVSANLSARNGGLEQYRYECVHCGEEVYLAAAKSVNMVAHFRHRSGNNDVDCEKYLGQYGEFSVDPRSRKSKNERVEFYFDSSTKTFFLGISFSDNEIATYDENSAEIEVKTSSYKQPFSTLRINNFNFAPDTPSMITIKQFSYSYYLSNTLNNISRRYNLFRNDNIPTFFKIQGSETEYRAKLVRSTSIYTDVLYFCVMESQYKFLPVNYPTSDIEVLSTFHFETMGKKFIGYTLKIKNKTIDVESLFSSWGYQVEASEVLTLLWPPAIQVNESLTINSDNAFLYSSFNLQPHGNINVDSTDISIYRKGISRVLVNSKVKVFCKNAEILIERRKINSTDNETLYVEEKCARDYKVMDDRTYYHFNRSGTTPIRKGQSVFLTPVSLIKRYNFGYLDGVIYPEQQNELSAEQLLHDLLIHYKRTEKFFLDSLVTIDLSDTASKYIEKCVETGIINSAAKRFIEEGQI